MIMNILVLGSLSHLATNFIIKYGDNFKSIVSIDNVSYCSQSTWTIMPFVQKAEYKFIRADINDMNLENVIVVNSITHILNCAASTHVDKSYEDFSNFSKDNIKLVCHLMNAMKSLKLLNYKVKLIHLSTDEVYGDNYETPRTENDLLSPSNPYSSSKASGDMIINSYCYSYNMWKDVVVLRPNNLAGLFQYPDKILPLFYNRIVENKEVIIHGSGNQTRCFISTEHVCDAIFILLINSKIWNPCTKNIFYNVSYNSQTGISVNNIYTIIKNITNVNHNKLVYSEDRPYNDKRYMISNIKIANLFESFKINNNKKNIMLINKFFYAMNSNSEDAIKLAINQMSNLYLSVQ